MTTIFIHSVAIIHANQLIPHFHLQTEEAVTSAVAEFQAQGVDLSNIITTASGGDLNEHPLAATMKELETALDAADAHEAQAPLQSLCSAIETSIASSPEDARQMGAVLLSLAAPQLTLRSLTIAAQPPRNLQTETTAAKALKAMLSISADMRAAFRENDGAATLAASISSNDDDDDDSSYAHLDAEVAAAVLYAAAVSGVKDEAGKGAAMEAELGNTALRLLRDAPSLRASRDVVLGACALLNSLTTADDESLPSSRAFANARQLAKEGAAAILVSTLQQYSDTRDVVYTLCGALRQISANDEICQEAAAAGAVPLCLSLIDNAIAAADIPLCRAALNVLRQLASSDAVKSEIYEKNGLESIKNSLSLAAATQQPSAAVAEQALGLLTNITLRNPEIAASAAAPGGCVQEALRAMRAVLDADDDEKKGGGGGGAERRGSALRQGCMALRNIAGRCVEEREGMLRAGAEVVVRAAQAAYPEQCQDVGLAALRDLGLDNYKD